ncbi:hypothetical protein [Streptococcus sp. NLN64]|uniref:hypothetical protein n=1 Tax=Streptococcus sp. NLN64 TaxID=2822799 RepID=UPI0018CAC081|nr:hypothetical protein [Streptococcus sp. NLN64]MBG9368263.1 hypothetical protein [Streptococcus sp. NLN64]
MVTGINEERLQKQLDLIKEKKFKRKLDEIRENEISFLEELQKIESGEIYDFDLVYDGVTRLAKGQTLYKGLMLGYTVLNTSSGNVAQGRRMGRSEADIALYEAIFRNEERRPRLVTRFCEEHNIPRSKYNRIARIKVKHEKDKEFLADIKNKVTQRA